VKKFHLVGEQHGCSPPASIAVAARIERVRPLAMINTFDGLPSGVYAFPATYRFANEYRVDRCIGK
jgi:hypothetical protein